MYSQSSRGLSLVELLVVISILGLLLAVAQPSVRGTLEDETLKSTARQIHGLMRLAHQEAMAKREFVVLELDLRTYPEPDRVRLISDAQWNNAESRWEGTTMRGETPLLIDGGVDLAYLAMGPDEYASGIQALVINAAGQVGFNNGPLTGEWDLMLEIPAA